MDKVIKRNKKQVPFDEEKIKVAVRKANAEVPKKHRLSEEEIDQIAAYVKNLDKKLLGVEAINDIIINKLVEMNKPQVVNAFIEYRYQRKLRRQIINTTDNVIKDFLGGDNEYWRTENANKNTRLVTVQRDKMAGIVSEDLVMRYKLPEDIVKAHKAGIIHYHDADYDFQKTLHNCDLINMGDVLENGSMLNGFKIDPQKRLLTGTTVATQFITGVSSSQYGGCSMNLSDLAPLVDKSRKYWKEKFSKFKILNIWPFTYLKKAMVNFFLKQEIVDSVQTFNYQLNSMSTTNGQAPFITLFMYLNERPECEADHALLIEEFLKQRMKGMKNKDGVWVTPAFPKLIYVLQENNITKGSKYYYLTRLAAKCSAKRLVPDYISEKKMIEYKGDCYAVMGCRSCLTPDRFSDRLGNIANAGNFSKQISKDDKFELL